MLLQGNLIAFTEAFDIALFVLPFEYKKNIAQGVHNTDFFSNFVLGEPKQWN